MFLSFTLSRRLQAVELLLSRGSEINGKSNFGSTPLHFAASLSPEWTDDVKEFMKHSALEVNPRNKDGQTPLHLACSRGHFHTVDMLLGHNGIDVNVVDKNGDTPLHEAVQRRNYELVSLLLNQDSVQLDIKNHREMTPLLLSVSEGHLGMVHKLIAKGADVNDVNNEGNNCLHLAVKMEGFHSEVEPLNILDKFVTFVIGKQKEDISSQFDIKCRCCHENLATVRLQPCGDLVLCENCSSEMTFKRCPVCREYTLSKSEFVLNGEHLFTF
ncbi:serine/threonine-protein phosphatase 6 regulatory ankyrin repeat subunit C-like [Octopus sinensis]|uniref:Serine/threonine-protein phosphatase 6 regulatory ankyrin repeat subunit C-like n=1 Tax=Octopus sinensis TaxID=2607531 RepID=A0A6P7SCS1_9MOLL|nr:serine/threonine-protein phosphatase 6 regulatory ankyrin repeat subunit C-like [Octopus sinensis]